jgi:hypothetical protein
MHPSSSLFTYCFSYLRGLGLEFFKGGEGVTMVHSYIYLLIFTMHALTDGRGENIT